MNVPDFQAAHIIWLELLCDGLKDNGTMFFDTRVQISTCFLERLI